MEFIKILITVHSFGDTILHNVIPKPIPPNHKATMQLLCLLMNCAVKPPSNVLIALQYISLTSFTDPSSVSVLM